MADINRKRSFDRVDDGPEFSAPSAGSNGAREDTYPNSRRDDRRQRGGDYDSYRHRRPRKPRLPRELEALYNLSRIGERADKTEADILAASELVVSHIDDDKYEERLLERISAIAIEQPHKLFVLATFIECCNARSSDVGERIVRYFQSEIQQILDGWTKVQPGEVDDDYVGDITRLKAFSRVCALLVPIFEDPESVITLFSQMLDLAIKLQASAAKRSGFAEALYVSYAISIPYIRYAARDKLQKECDELASKASEFKVKESSISPSSSHLFYSKDEGLAPYKPVSLAEIVSQSVAKFDVGVFKDSWKERESILKGVPEEDNDSYEPVEKAEKAEPEKAEPKESEDKMDVDKEEKNEKEEKEEKEGDKEEKEGGKTDDKTDDKTTDKTDQDKDAEDADKTDQMDVDAEDHKNSSLHKLGQFNVPEPSSLKQTTLRGTTDKLWEYPRYALEIFHREKSAFQTVPPVDSYTSIILRDLLQDMIQNMSFNRVTVSRQLMTILEFINDKQFSKPNSSEEKLTIVNDMKNGVDLINDLETNPDIPDSMKSSMIKSAKRIEVEFQDDYKSTWKMEEVVTESIVDLLLRIPQPLLPSVYYETLIADTCGRDWAIMKKSEDSQEKVTFAKTIASAINFFYQNSSTLDYDARKRFICWILLQLSSFNFEWKWSDWLASIKKLSGSQFHPKMYIIRNIIGKEVRLSTPAFIRSTLPEELRKFTDLSLLSSSEVEEFDSQLFGTKLAASAGELNQQKLESDLTNLEPEEGAGNAETYHLLDQYLFNNADHPFHEVCHSIYSNMQGGESLQSFNDLIVELKRQIFEAEESERPSAGFDRYLVTLVTQSVCIIGSRSLSVIEGGALELCGNKVRKVLGLPLKKEDSDEEEVANDQLSDITNTEERQKWVIEGTLRLWNNEPRIGYLILEKMRNKGIVKSSQIIQSLFEPSDKPVALTQIYADELLDRLLIDEDNDAENETKEERGGQFGKCVVKELAALVKKAGKAVDLSDETFMKNGEDATKPETDLLWEIKELQKTVGNKVRRMKENTVIDSIEKESESQLEGDVAKQVQVWLEELRV